LRPGFAGAGGLRRRPGRLSLTGRADRASRGGRGWEDGRGLPVMPESLWDESP